MNANRNLDSTSKVVLDDIVNRLSDCDDGALLQIAKFLFGDDHEHVVAYQNEIRKAYRDGIGHDPELFKENTL